MVSANGAPTGSPAMAAVAEWVPPPLNYHRRCIRVSRTLVKFPFRKTYLKTVFFSILKKKLLKKKYKSRIPLVYYNTVAKPQLFPSNMFYIVGRLHIRLDEYYS